MSKLRAILLLEDDFNILHKIIFKSRILLDLESKNLIPAEVIGGRRSQSAIHAALNKTLIADIANQSKSLLAVVSADAMNYCDRVAYPLTSLAAQHFSIQINYVLVLLK